ncbi:MAG: HAD-IC family P-type ATPase, partial [Bdellovibrionales bacterium]|nr:HAD-IC family P-type ATPase [Bdellovibrionales bacterium]
MKSVSKESLIALLALAAIVLHLLLRYAAGTSVTAYDAPLIAALIAGGGVLVFGLLGNVVRGEFGSDLLAGISIVTAVLLGEYLAGTLVVLMLSGGTSLERYASKSASSVLRALANRMPNVGHRRETNGQITEVAIADIKIGDELVILPHEISPVDGQVIEGHGIMDESYLTGEPFEISKTPGSEVLSGAINGDTALTIRASKLAQDSRYSKIVGVMLDAEKNRPRIRKLGDTLGAWYTPLAVSVAIIAWLISGSATRFLAVLVVATPCPLLIAIPITIIGGISLAAKRGIIIRDPRVLEQIDNCRTIIFDKTGTLTYGEPELTKEFIAEGFDSSEVLTLVASLENYSKHPLASAIRAYAEKRGVKLAPATEMNEPPGKGLVGTVAGHEIVVTSRT